MKCLSCHVEKDPNNLELYPYDDDSLSTESSMPPLLTIECELSTGFHIAIMCHECWHRLCENTQGIDMWISEKCWMSLNPKTKAEDLPKPIEGKDKWKAETYA